MLSYSEFLAKIRGGEITKVVITDNGATRTFIAKTKDNKFYKAIGPSDDQRLLRLLDKSTTEVAFQERSLFAEILLSILPLALFVLFWIWWMKKNQMHGGGGKFSSFFKSGAKLYSDDGGQIVTFADVAGVDETKEELLEIVEFLKDPRKFTKLGGRMPKGILLIGAPGTGKTLLARAVAGEAAVPFFSVSGSEFVEAFVGVGASRVRDLFAQAHKSAPCIIFVDELDAIGGKRNATLSGLHQEHDQTLGQLLVEMDGFANVGGIIVLAATNRPEILDEALLRAGRFDQQIIVPRPDIRGREMILNIHAGRIKLADNIDLKIIAKGTVGMVGADLAALVNKAALIAARQGRECAEQKDFEVAKDQIFMGPERKSAVISSEEKGITAYHEAGHTIVACMTRGADPIHKVSIIPRGMALGATHQLPERDRYNYSKEELLANIAVLYGGRIAEELQFGSDKVTTGAQNDIERATMLMRRMVQEFGMSDSVGPISFAQKNRPQFLGDELLNDSLASEATRREIDEEVKAIARQQYEKARDILISNKTALDALAKCLLEKEEIDGAEVNQIIANHKTY